MIEKRITNKLGNKKRCKQPLQQSSSLINVISLLFVFFSNKNLTYFLESLAKKKIIRNKVFFDSYFFYKCGKRQLYIQKEG